MLFRVCFIEMGDRRDPFFFAVASAREAQQVLAAVSQFDLHFRPEPSDIATCGWAERQVGDDEWEELTDDEIEELAEQSA